MNCICLFNSVLSFAILLSGCNNKENCNDEAIRTIDIDNNIKNFKIRYLSEFVTHINYVPFESNKDFNFSRSSEFVVNNDFVLIAQKTLGATCALFDTAGKFIRTIGKNGRGPGEYQFIVCIGFGFNGNIFLSDLSDLLEYKITGTFINKYNNSMLINDEHSIIATWYPVNDSVFLGNIPNSTGMIVNKAVLVSNKGSICKFFPNYTVFKREHEVSGFFENFAHICQYNEQIYYKNLYNDTLFYLDGNQDLIPMYSFNLGKYKEPVEVRARTIKDRFQYIYVWNVYQLENWLFIQCALGKFFPAGRLTPKEYNITGAKPSMFNTMEALGIYDIRTREFVFCKPATTDNPLFATGLYNDIDAGPKFFPQKQINDSTMVMWIEAKLLKEHVSSADFRNNNPKYPEKKEELYRLANSLNEFDNPVLMFVTFKK